MESRQLKSYSQWLSVRPAKKAMIGKHLRAGNPDPGGPILEARIHLITLGVRDGRSFLGERQVLIYPPRGWLGRITRSYLGNAGDRSKRASYGFMSCWVMRTPSG